MALSRILWNCIFLQVSRNDRRRREVSLAGARTIWVSKATTFACAQASKACLCVFAELLIIDDKPAREKLHRFVCPAGNKMHFLWFDEEGKSGRDESVQLSLNRRLGTAFISLYLRALRRRSKSTRRKRRRVNWAIKRVRALADAERPVQII